MESYIYMILDERCLKNLLCCIYICCIDYFFYRSGILFLSLLIQIENNRVYQLVDQLTNDWNIITYLKIQN